MTAIAGLELELLPAGAADAVALAALVNQAFRRYAILVSDRTSPGELRDEAGADGEFLTAFESGELAACAMVRPAAAYYSRGSENPFGGDIDDALYFGLAAVDQPRMNRGIGRLLVKKAEELGRERGFARLVLTTLREFGLDRYYARLGYRVTSIEDHEPGHWGVVVPHRVCHMAVSL